MGSLGLDGGGIPLGIPFEVSHGVLVQTLFRSHRFGCSRLYGRNVVSGNLRESQDNAHCESRSWRGWGERALEPGPKRRIWAQVCFSTIYHPD